MSFYNVKDGETSTGLILNGDSMYISSGGKASNTTVTSSPSSSGRSTDENHHPDTR